MIIHHIVKMQPASETPYSSRKCAYSSTIYQRKRCRNKPKSQDTTGREWVVVGWGWKLFFKIKPRQRVL